MKANNVQSYQKEAGVMKTNKITIKLDADGELVPRPKFCTQCGFHFKEETARFCGECGSKRA